ncbi:MAG: ribbon-helix-helix domain-containing protein [Nanoarchaeota archaeon]|nr:ribbon-helix-helix domain-containing protein [Nanoarchaeota archaeon]
MSRVVVTNVRLSRDLVRMLDSLVKKKLFSSRSEAIRVFCREYIHENSDNNEGNA